MDRYRIYKIYRTIRNSLFAVLDREFLTFLFFLVISGSFWMLIYLNETHEAEISIPIEIHDIPQNVVMMSDRNDTLRVVVRDKGYSLLSYLYGDKERKLRIGFKSHAKDNGRGTLSANELNKMIYQQLYSSSKIVSVKPERYDFYYSHGQSKKVPVRLNGKIQPDSNHYLSGVIFRPSMVDVYGSQNALDTLKHALTEYLDIKNITDTLTMSVNLNEIKGMKFVPSVIKLTALTDVLTEENVEIPVVAKNMPEGKILRTFPSKVKVTFTIGAGDFRKADMKMFKVVADYKEIVNSPSEKCNIYLESKPKEVINARIEIKEVDYLIEEQ